MKALSEEILTGHKERKKRIQELRERAGAVKNGVARFLHESRRFHAEMAEDLKKKLREKRADLFKDVIATKDDFKRREREVRAELREAKKIWKSMKNILGGKPE
jgi:molecular chaperone GrpE (heat shock protein)